MSDKSQMLPLCWRICSREISQIMVIQIMSCLSFFHRRLQEDLGNKTVLFCECVRCRKAKRSFFFFSISAVQACSLNRSAVIKRVFIKLDGVINFALASVSTLYTLRRDCVERVCSAWFVLFWTTPSTGWAPGRRFFFVFFFFCGVYLTLKFLSLWLFCLSDWPKKGLLSLVILIKWKCVHWIRSDLLPMCCFPSLARLVALIFQHFDL